MIFEMRGPGEMLETFGTNQCANGTLEWRSWHMYGDKKAITSKVGPKDVTNREQY